MTVHVPVLLQETLDFFAPSGDEIGRDPQSLLLDCTFGGGGHSGEILARDPSMRIIGVDRDPEAIDRGRRKFAVEIAHGRLQLHHAPFSQIKEILGSRQVSGVLADLGFSSDQLDEAKRGFSFQEDSALDMRMDTTRGATALDLLLEKSEKEIADLIWEYGEERYSRKIAGAIVRERNRGALPRTSKGLAELIQHAVPPSYRFGRLHPATRSFQAFRIAVNGELDQLDALLKAMLPLDQGVLREGARVAIISFHSLEDRKVKWEFREAAQAGGYQILTKKPVEATDAEIAANPRARSAKLRVLEKSRA